MAEQERKRRQGDIGLSGEQKGAEAGQREKHVTSMKDKGVESLSKGQGRRLECRRQREWDRGEKWVGTQRLTERGSAGEGWGRGGDNGGGKSQSGRKPRERMRDWEKEERIIG